jgi:hypothetical protein
MTKRSQKLVLTFLVIVLAIIGCGQWYLRYLDRVDSGNIELRGAADPVRPELYSLIGRYKMGEVEGVDISAATNFSWQRLYIFGPYTSLLEINDTVGRSWRKKCYTDVHVSDAVQLLVFTDGKTVVHCLDFPINEGWFPEFREGLSPQEARFTVGNNNSLIWVGNQ